MDNEIRDPDKSGKLDHFAENGPGPGEEAANFRAPRPENPAGSSGESSQQPEAEKPTPTKESDSFLKRWGERLGRPLGKMWDAAANPLAVLPTEVISAGGILALGGPNILPDIAQGRWGVLAAKGALAAVMAVPAVRFGLDWRRDNRMDAEEAQIKPPSGQQPPTGV